MSIQTGKILSAANLNAAFMSTSAAQTVTGVKKFNGDTYTSKLIVSTDGTFADTAGALYYSSGLGSMRFDAGASKYLDFKTYHSSLGVVIRCSTTEDWVNVAANASTGFIGYKASLGGAGINFDTAGNTKISGTLGVNNVTAASKLHVYESTTLTDATNGITIEQAGTGDAILQFLLSGVYRWTAGIDNSDSDKFKIGRGTNWVTGTDITIDTNGNVGIGTSTPTFKLDVGGRANANSFTVSSSVTDLVNNSPWYGLGNSNLLLAGRTGSQYAVQLAGYWGLLFKSSSGTLTLEGGGNFGVGTTTPGYLLDVNGTGNIGNTSTRQYLKISSSQYPELRFKTPTDDEVMRIGVAHADDASYGISSGDMYFFSQSTNRMDVVVKKSGGVLLAQKGGTVAIGGPLNSNYDLEVIGTTRVTSTNDSLFLKSGDDTSGTRHSVVFYGSDSNAEARITSGNFGNYNGGLLFEVRNSASAGTTTTKVLEIASSGYVGINNLSTAPVQALDVYGNIRLTGDFITNKSYNGFLTDAGAQSPIKVGGLSVTTDYGATTDVISGNIYAQGKIGVGVVNPTAQIGVSGSSATAVMETIDNTNTAGYSVLRLNSNGGDNASGASLIHMGGTYSGGTLMYAPSKSFLVGYDTGGLGLAATDATGVINFITGSNTSANERMRIDATGNVGIGTTSPAKKLDVNGESIFRNILNVASGSLQVNGGTTLTVTSGGNFNFDSGVLYGDATNNRVGINTSSPAYSLDVNGTSAFRNKLSVLTSAGGGLVYAKEIGTGYVDGGNAVFIADTENTTGSANYAYEARVNGTRTLSIRADGYLSTPQQIASTLADGTAPLVITSTTKVINLNVDRLDDMHASSSNTASTVVSRDGSGNFSAGTITAALSGNASTATKLATARTISLTSDVTGSTTFDGNGDVSITATVADNSHNHTSSNISDATNANTANMIVKRDASGNFSAGTITAALSGNATTSTTATHLANGGAGQMPYQTGAGATSMISAGTSGQVLKSNGTSAPSWQTLDMTYLPGSPWKEACRVATTADLGASLQTSTTLTGYSQTQSLAVTTTLSSTTATTTSTAGIKVGSVISGNANIPASTTVTSITNSTTFVMSAAATAAGSAVTTTFTNTIAALTVDGVSLSAGDRILVKNQSTVGGISVTANRDNGIYTVTNAGSTSVAWVLTRATDADTSAKLAASLVTVDLGSTNGGYLFDNDFKSTDTLGTTAMPWNSAADNGKKLNYFASTTSSELASVISDETGSGSLVFSASPTLTGTVTASAITASGLITANGNIKIPSNGEIQSAYNSNYILKDHANGNVTLSAAGGVLYLGYQNSTGIKLYANLLSNDASGNNRIADATGRLYYLNQDIDTKYLGLDGGDMTGNLAIKTAGNAAIELGRVDGTASTPIIDFHTGATACDYDVRMIATGGNGLIGQGTLNVLATSFQYNGNVVLSTGNTNYNTWDGWLRENGDNSYFKCFGGSRTMVFRTDGTTAYGDNGAYPFIWMYGGDTAATNRKMILNTDGTLWTAAYGWLDDKFWPINSTFGGDINVDVAGGERHVRSHTTGSDWGMYFSTGGGGFYDWTNSRPVWSYTASSNTLSVSPSFTSFITFSNHTTGRRGIQGTVADNDSWFVGGYGASSNSGYLELATGDDGTEPIMVRQYSGGTPTGGGTVARTAYLLDNNGNTVFPGDLYLTSQGNGLWLKDETTGTSWQLHTHGDTLRIYSGSTEYWFPNNGSFAANTGVNGYQKLPSGLIIQWGYNSGTTGVYHSYNFQIAFPNGCRSVVATQQGWGGMQSIAGVTTTKFDYWVNGDGTQTIGFNWIAIGY